MLSAPTPVNLPKEAKTCNHQNEPLLSTQSFKTRTTGKCCLRKRIHQRNSSKMLSHRASTVPLTVPVTTTTCSAGAAAVPASSSSSSSSSGTGTGSGSGSGPDEELTPRLSSDADSTASDTASETRTSFSDEAQACFNLLLILRNDTQHLISLRNDNLAALEAKSSTATTSSSSSPSTSNDDDSDTAARPALLACINESIVAATRSITELGPFLERHRWPAPATGGAQRSAERQSFTLKPARILLRKREQRESKRLAAAPATAAYEGYLSPRELFSWTLALTAQHTAVLVATDRLEQFLAYGVSLVSEEEVKRREGRASWWMQGRGEFENVDLIQSLLAPRPRRMLLLGATSTHAAAATPEPRDQAPGEQRVGEDEGLPAISEHGDGRSETLRSEPCSESSLSPWGLTAPKHQRQGSLQRDDHFIVRRVMTEPLNYSPSSVTQDNDARLPRMETFGPAKPTVPSSHYDSSKQRPRIATSPLPPLVGLPKVLSDTVVGSETGPGRLAPVDGEALAASTGASPISQPASRHSVPLLSSLLTPGVSQPQKQVQDSSQPSHAQRSRPVSSVAETPYTPYTPYTPHTSMDQRILTLFAQQKLPSKTVQPVLEEWDTMLVSPVGSQEPHIATLGVSPVESQPRSSIVPHEDDDSHWPYLAYMARKQAVSTSRWSLRRSRTSGV